MWVADMDFRTPPFIIDSVKKRIECEIFGYTEKPNTWYQSIINWQKKTTSVSDYQGNDFVHSWGGSCYCYGY